MTGEAAIEAIALEKSYGDVRVLDGVDLRVERGTVFALLGPNGAGKTTTVRILSTLIRPDAGRARVAGFDVVADRRRVRRAISLTGQYAALDELQTGAENLRMMGRLTGLSGAAARARAAELLARFDLRGRGGPPGRRVLGRHAAAPRPRGVARRPSRGDLPRRADDRPGPPQPAGDVGRRRRPRRLGRDRLPHDAVPRGGRRPGRPDRGHRRRPRRRRGHGRGAQAPRRRPAARPRPRGRGRVRRRRRAARRPRAAARPGRPRRSASRPTAPPRTCARSSTRSTRTAIASRGSRSTTRPSTTSSSPSPAVRPRRTTMPRRSSMSDALTMSARSVRLSMRHVDALITSLLLPVMLMLIFVELFGGAIETGANDYVTYVVPGVILLCAGFGAATTAVSVCAGHDRRDRRPLPLDGRRRAGGARRPRRRERRAQRRVDAARDRRRGGARLPARRRPARLAGRRRDPARVRRRRVVAGRRRSACSPARPRRRTGSRSS